MAQRISQFFEQYVKGIYVPELRFTDILEILIITFLISQQNNITRIRGCIDRLCKRYGEKKVSLDGMEYWSFPTPQQLGTATEEELRVLGMGYRARYLVETTQSILKGEISLEKLYNMR